MSQRLSDLLWELQAAIREAVWNSDSIAAALAALEREGRDPQIAFDVALLDSGRPDASAHTDGIPHDSGLTFNSSDIRFLRSLAITLEEDGR